MYCRQCGTQNDDTALFCRQCGAPLREGREQEMRNDPGQYQQYDEAAGQDPYEAPYENQGYQDQGYQNREYQNQGYQDQQYQNGGYRDQGYQYQEYQDGPYQEQPYQDYDDGREGGNYQKPVNDRRPPRKPLSKMVWVIAAEAVAAAALIFGSYKIISSKFSPETVALNYWKAAAECNWEEAYEYCEFPDSEFLTKEMYLDAHASDTEKIDYKSAEVTDIASAASGYLDEYSDSLGSIASLFGVDTRQLINDAASYAGDIYVITYKEKGSSEEKTDYLTLSKTGKKQFLLLDEWTVTPTETYSEDVRLNVPAEAQVTLNGSAVAADYEEVVADDTSRKIVTFRYLFNGSYQLAVSEEGMESYQDLWEVSSNDYDISRIDLHPSQEVLESVCEQAGTDIQTILEAALDSRSFSKIEDLFSEEALTDGDVQTDYENLVDKIKGDGKNSGVLSLTLKNLKTSSDGTLSDNRIELSTEADRSVSYIRYYGDGSSSDSITMYSSYVKDGDSWKLENLPITSGLIY